jgi:hypothetical protein
VLCCALVRTRVRDDRRGGIGGNKSTLFRHLRANLLSVVFSFLAFAPYDLKTGENTQMSRLGLSLLLRHGKNECCSKRGRESGN